MRRPLIILPALIVLAGGYTALSHRFGVMAESTIRERADALARIGVVADITDYQRGLFQSRLTLDLDLTDFVRRNSPNAGPNFLDSLRRVPVTIVLRHGPLVFAETGLIGLAALVTDLGNARASLPDGGVAAVSIPVSVRVTTGGIDGRIAIAAIDVGAENGGTALSSGEMRLDFASDNAMRAFSGKFVSGDIRLANDGIILALGPISIDIDMTLAGERTWIGSQSGEIASVRVGSAAGDVYRSGITQFNSSTVREDNQDLLGSTTSFKIREMVINPPGREPFTADIAMNGSVEHVSTAAIEELQTAVDELAKAGAAVGEAQAAVFLERMMDAANRAAVHRPQINLSDFAVTHAEGSGHLLLDIGLVENAKFSADALNDALGMITASGSIMLDNGLLRAGARNFIAPDPTDSGAVENALSMLQMQLTATGMFRAEGDRIISDLAFVNGVFSMNGMPIYDAAAASGPDVPQ